MSLLEKASLIITPNGYKAGKLYSVIPNTALGDMDVVRATTATRVNSLGLIETVGVNVPRIDYTNGSCPSLLVEPQRTNILTYSNEFTNWSGSGVTLITNFAISPDGNLNATRYQANSGSYIFRGYSSTDNLTHSVWVKSNTGINQNITFGGQTVSTFVVTNEWQRIDKSVIISEGLTQISTLQTTDILIWGAQAEQGSYSTSYIPTVATSVTRNADVISKTGISSLIDSQQGVLFADLQFFTEIGNIRSINISNGSNDNRIGFYGHPSVVNRITFAISSGGVTTDINFSGVTLTNRNKVLIRYSGTTFTSFVNGVKSINQTFTPFTANFLNRIGLDYGEDILRYEGRINSIQLYKTALTDQECINLTTL